MESLLGRTAKLVVRSIDATAVSLSPEGDGDATIPLPLAELASPPVVGTSVDVFVHLDSEDRPIATTRTPKLTLGEVEFLSVTDIVPFGAFVSWGLKKDLLVPLREQTRPMRVGDRYAIGLYLDDTKRLAGTMRVAEMLPAGADFKDDERVRGVAWREEAPGLFVILEKKYVALLPASEPHALRPGDEATFRVTHVHADGKVEVSLRGHAHEEIDADATRLLDLLAGPLPPRLDDAASPELIRGLLGISKKAYKRAVGRLLKTEQIERDEVSGAFRVKRAPPETT